jgi:hypothetical protein
MKFKMKVGKEYNLEVPVIIHVRDLMSRLLSRLYNTVLGFSYGCEKWFLTAGEEP